MKHWEIEYTIKYRDEKVIGGIATLEAETIIGALFSALENIKKPMLLDDNICEVVIWSVCIMEDDVFVSEDEVF